MINELFFVILHKIKSIMKLLSIFLLLIIIFGIGCKRDQPMGPPNKSKSVFPDSTGNILASAGDTIVIKILNTGSDGGYAWYHTIDFNPTIAGFIDYHYEIINPIDTAWYGGSEYEIWRYSALLHGSSMIFFELYQHWVVPHQVYANKTFYLTVQ